MKENMKGRGSRVKGQGSKGKGQAGVRSQGSRISHGYHRPYLTIIPKLTLKFKSVRNSQSEPKPDADRC